MSEQHPTSRIAVTIDVSAWSAAQRDELFAAVASIEARLDDRPVVLSGDEDIEETGWTMDAYRAAMERLLLRYFVQAQAINDAIKSRTGYISRADVYALGNYPETRSLKGFTRPINRAVAAVVEDGLLPEDAADLLAPVYDPNVTGFQRVKGFQVPLEIVRMLHAGKTEA